MQIVPFGDNLHEISNPVFWENKKNTVNLSSAEIAKRVVKVNEWFSMTNSISNRFIGTFLH